MGSRDQELAIRIAEEVVARLNGRDDRPLYTVKTLAAKLNISERGAQDLIGGPEPEIASFLLGARGRRIDPAEVDRYIAERQSRAASDQEGSDAEAA